MQKQMSSKKIGIILCVAAAVIAVVVVLLIVNRKDEAFRSIMVYELEGSAVIERADIGAIDAAENLYLESGDRVSVRPDSMMRMKLDDDKYITAEADTVFSLEAEGDGQNSKTRIRLEQGAVTNEIQKPLSGESLYETSTPNSVMAVRGTIYRAQLSDDGAGGQNMRLCCFDGTVATMPILPDGSYGEEVLVHAGSELTVYSDGTVDGPKDIDFETLPEQTWQTLSDLLESGAPVTGITSEELAQIKQDAEKAVPEQSETADQTENVQAAEETQNQDTEDQDTEEQSTEEQQAPEAKGKTTISERKPAKKQSENITAQSENKPGSEAGQKPSKPQDAPPAQGNT
ncbi:MAG: FecR domain-containing protein, partial [Lachnospiraceae bacterium]|nr:FecR domain-containing protein [Lachnospiraceae bacterium]